MGKAVGDQDTITRPAMAKALFQQASLPETAKMLLIVPGGTHQDSALSRQYRQGFASFLR